MKDEIKLVFDGNAWSKTGDIGDNSVFWKPATIIAERKTFEGDEDLVDVMFDDGKVSKGHYKESIKDL